MTQPTAQLDLVEGIAGQRILITAGAAGIGRAIAERLGRLGASLFVCDIDDDALSRFGEEFPGSGRIRADVADEHDVDRMFASVGERLGGLDALINNAGIAGRPAGSRRLIRPTGGAVSMSA